MFWHHVLHKLSHFIIPETLSIRYNFIRNLSCIERLHNSIKCTQLLNGRSKILTQIWSCCLLHYPARETQAKTGGYFYTSMQLERKGSPWNFYSTIYFGSSQYRSNFKHSIYSYLWFPGLGILWAINISNMFEGAHVGLPNFYFAR